MGALRPIIGLIPLDAVVFGIWVSGCYAGCSGRQARRGLGAAFDAMLAQYVKRITWRNGSFLRARRLLADAVVYINADLFSSAF